MREFRQVLTPRLGGKSPVCALEGDTESRASHNTFHVFGSFVRVQGSGFRV